MPDLCIFSPNSDKTTFTTGDRSIVDILIQFNCLLQTCSFLTLQDFNQLCGLLWCHSSPSEGTHSLQRMHWWASDVMLHFSKYVLMKKRSSTSWMTYEWIKCHTFFISGGLFIWSLPVISRQLFWFTSQQWMSREGVQAWKRFWNRNKNI